MCRKMKQHAEITIAHRKTLSLAPELTGTPVELEETKGVDGAACVRDQRPPSTHVRPLACTLIPPAPQQYRVHWAGGVYMPLSFLRNSG